jgi:UDP-N-acetylmuramoylalanine--D-glutamate ligase
VRGQRATVMGLGHFGGGVAAARWLARAGAVVTVTDLADEQVLANALNELEGEPIAAYHLGGHRAEDFDGTDLVVVNPAVRPGNRYLDLARRAGAELATEIELFMRLCPAASIGVTGSNGKSTTAAMTAAILQADGRRAWLGGNLGGSLLDNLDQIGPADWVVLEISSFQLWHASPDARMPDVAIVTNCTPNHLDWHGTFADYAAAKQRMLSGQRADGLAVLNATDPEVASWSPLVRGRPLPLVADDEVPPLPVPGHHNRIDARLAATAALGIGCASGAVREGLASYRPLPGRLELVAVAGGRRFYNDTSATTPESTIAALEALPGPLWLLAGGGDKRCDFSALAEAVARSTRGAAFFGSVRERLRSAVLQCRGDLPCTAVETLAEALTWCFQRSGAGESIVLSPACTSHDQFQNFRERGRRFAELVGTLAEPRNR